MQGGQARENLFVSFQCLLSMLKGSVRVYLGLGMGLAPLLKIEYPSADLVSAALCDVLEVVGVKGYSMKGKWVTSWASSAKNVCLVTFNICKESGSVPCQI